jgi:O-antigen ligase
LPPQLALLLTSTFVLIVITIEYRRSDITSAASWILSLWLVYSGSKGIGTFLNINTTIESGSLPDRYFLLGIAIIGILILMKRAFSWGAALKRNGLFVFILAYMLLSVVWAKAPGISFRRWGRELITLIMLCLLISEEFPAKTFVSAFKRAIYFYLPFSILLINYFGIFGREYNRWTGELMWVGLASQKNGLALFCAFSIIFLIWLLWQDLSNWKILEYKLPLLVDTLMLALAVYLMMGPERTLTYSATSLLSLLTGLVAILLLKQAVKKGTKLDKGVVALCLILVLVGIFMPLLGKIPVRGLPQLFGRSETLTGRTEIWNSLLPYAQKHFILGYGYGGFWTTSLRIRIASHAHNGYLDTILNLGIVGLILLIVFLIKIAGTCARLIDSGSNIFLLFLSIIFMYLIHNMGEVSLGDFQSLPSALIAIISFLVNEEKNKSTLEVIES